MLKLLKTPRVFSKEFRFRAVQRMLSGASGTALALDLGVLRKSLYEWKDSYLTAGLAGLAAQRGRPASKQPGAPTDEIVAESAAVRGEILRARARIEDLERQIGKQELELDFFAAALQRIKALD